jgi:MFS family permease
VREVTIVRHLADLEAIEHALTARQHLLDEIPTVPVPHDDGSSVAVFNQQLGPFSTYRREVAIREHRAVETTTYTLDVPWFTWLFAWPVRRAMRRGGGDRRPLWWAPPDRLSHRQVSLLGLLAVATMVATFANTLFTQTSTFAADTFGAGPRALGAAGAVVRLGVVISLPFAIVADRVGRRQAIVLLGWLTPIMSAIGAIAPNFGLLVVSQTVARPLGIALAFIAGVAATEEMPRNSRAYALSVLAMAAGFGAGVAVMALRFCDTGPQGWRIVYVLSLIWLPVSVSLGRHLRETRRFEKLHTVAPRLPRSRLAVTCAVALTSNLFIAATSYFQNNYLDKVRHYSGGGIALFTTLTVTPASIGLIVGGRLADIVGRRRLIALCTPTSTALIVLGFSVGGPMMWLSALGGGVLAGMAYPAFQVYRTELFPTGNRGVANAITTTTALLSGSIGILLVGVLRDHGWGYGSVMAVLAGGQILAVLIAWIWYPETAHLELEALNPDDPALDS